jgi:NAD(P)-dependent dehydrogenase (short-subunit alcohol dehydrogenase family)
MNLDEITKFYDFAGRTVVITGGAGVLGGEMSCALVGVNANVVILDKNPELAETVIKRFEQTRGKHLVVKADVLDKASLKAAASEVVDHFGHLDSLINAAGGNNPKATTNSELSFFELPAAALKLVSDLNLLGTILASQVFGEYMVAQN